jgi:hypothetical protein
VRGAGAVAADDGVYGGGGEGCEGGRVSLAAGHSLFKRVGGSNERADADGVAGMSHEELVKAVYDYTRETIGAFAKEDVLPDVVQVGNEVSNGFMWPSGKLPEHWDDFAELLYAGINGVDAGRGNHARPRIMIHVDHGGNVDKTRAFFDKINTSIRHTWLPHE